MGKGNFIIIGASYLQVPLIKKAKELGYTVHVFAWQDGAVGAEIADCFYPISITEKDEILKIIAPLQPVGVATIASDLAGKTVNYLARELNLPSNSAECEEISTNKLKMRESFLKNGVPSPKFIAVDEKFSKEKLKDFCYPLIVKSVDRSGSRGVTKVNKGEDLDQAISFAQNESFNKKAIIEEYITGHEYSVEMIAQNKEYHFLAITKKFTSGAPHFVEKAHLEPGIQDCLLKKNIIEETIKACKALQITNGAIHAELKVTYEGEIKFIEVASRMGGDYIGSHLVELTTGYDFVSGVIEVACGNKLSKNFSNHFEYAVVIFDTLPKQLINQNNLVLHEIIHEKKDTILDSSDRAEVYILASNDYSIIEQYIPNN